MDWDKPRVTYPDATISFLNSFAESGGRLQVCLFDLWPLVLVP